MRLLDRYIIRQFLPPLLFAFAAMTSIMLLNQVARRFGPLPVGRLFDQKLAVADHGVERILSSWLTLARNSLFERLANSAFWTASSSLLRCTISSC